MEKKDAWNDCASWDERPKTIQEGLHILADWFDAVYQDAGKNDAVQQDLRKWADNTTRLTAAASNLLKKHKLGAISEADVRWMETELKSIAGPETNSQSDWVSVPCTSPSCRGLKTGNPFPAVCKKGHEHHAVCNECFCK